MVTNETEQARKNVRGGWIRRVTACAAAVLLVMTGGMAANLTAGASKVSADDTSSGYTTDQQEALRFLNAVRAQTGVPPVTLHPAITRAAVAHASYYNENKDEHSGLSAHSETAGTPGFTGKTSIDRMKAAGWTSGGRGYAYGEVMHFGQPDSSTAVQGWLDTAYHRKIILSPRYNEVGIGLVQGTAVIDLGGPGGASPISRGISVYPYDHQTNVPVGFYGRENPNPLDQYGVEYSGYIISATAPTGISSYQAVIRDETSTEVPFYDELDGDTLFLYPKSVLKGHHTYTVRLSWQTQNSDMQIKTWSFTTGKGHSLAQLEPVLPEVTLNEGGLLQLKFRGRYDDGVTEAVDSGVTYISSNPKLLQISAAGKITGARAGEYTVKAIKDGKSAQVKVKVYPKWKTKVYSSVKQMPSDLSGHPLRSSLEWGLANGIITPSSDHLVKPNETISEAEFWTMLLKAYKVNIQSYQPAKTKHWADAAYLIAKERNYPLSGINNAAARSGSITRGKVAEIAAAADGWNVKGTAAIQYVMAQDYIRGVSELSISGFEGSRLITRADALYLIQQLQQKMSELRGRPAAPTPVSSLPPLPPRQLYIKPAILEDRSMFAEYKEDRKLIVEGKFSAFAGQTLTFKVQEKAQVSKHIEDVSVTLDSQGFFRMESGPYTPDALNLYLYTPEIIYYLSVQQNTMNDAKYGVR
ncbi:CAP domain-containing protein [Paenibacillus sp. JX-17]|uniref:CAP domain-containing protein n=1 Tax=Paenibacillus lacisoli TaxID=3064525 RepID=A0ABT9CIN2_9BACL|nr:CAP domain-containing protein [Paenibacillus sp. JX-17]MDO7907468.1 CAP domain-containing protein [Paenibacillus sp. JX-17]